MATPTPQSYESLLGSMLQTYMSKISVNDLNTGSAILSFFEAVAQQVYLANASNFSILRDYNLDRATGEALKRIAEEERVTPIPARVATGRITITDSTFEKIETKVYSGAAAPNIGSTEIKVSDASEFPASGQVYIGRGTRNVEGPLAYTAVTPEGGYYKLTIPSSTSKYHNISESVILAQGGNRSVTAGTVVVAPAAGGNQDVLFTTTQSVILLDGENSLSNIPVAAQQPGTEGNIARFAIKQFSTDPFTGASVTNEGQFTTGRDIESDDEIRVRVKRARLSKGLGTATAVRNSVIGAQANDEAATITSAEIISSSEDTVLYIDNGEGYEEKTAGVGLEYIVDYALGGETNFQLATGGQQSSVAKAFLETNAIAPFDLNGGDTLAISVGGVVTEHTFQNSDFKSPGAASAYEIVSSVNANSDLDWVARTADNTNKVAFFAKTEEREYLSVEAPTIGDDAAFILGLPSNEVETLRLYKNDQLLSKNGKLAIIESNNQSAWSTSIATGATLILAVDGTSPVTYTFNDADFIAEGSGYFTVDDTNSLESWANVFNNKIPGITVSVVGTQLQMVSNLGTNSRSKLDITGGSLVSSQMFNVSVSVGAESDYTFSRNTAQFRLKEGLAPGDKLTAGTDATKATINSEEVAGGAVTFTNDAHLWILVDNAEAEIINTGVAADSVLTVSKVGGNIIRYTSAVLTAFNDVEVGDWVIVWSEELAAGNRLEGRVYAKTATQLDLKITTAEYALASNSGSVVFKDGFTVIRTDKVPQKVVISAGTYNLFTVADLINEQLIGALSFVKNERYLSFTTRSEDVSGSLLIVDQNIDAANLALTKGDFSQSAESLYAFYVNETSEGDFPEFVHSKIATDAYADPTYTYLTNLTSATNLTTLNVNETSMLVGVHPFEVSPDLEDSAINNEQTQIRDINGAAVLLERSPFFKRVRINDRFYIASALDFSDNDSLVVVFDGDLSNKTFSIPLYRRATTDQTFGPNNLSFRAFDSDSGATTPFAQYFGDDFSFNNYKVMMNAKNVLHPTQTLVDEDAILIKATLMGLSGEKIRVGYYYPENANNDINHVLTVDDYILIKLFLKSGDAFTHSIKNDTEWNVTVVNVIPNPLLPLVGYSLVTYSHNGIGTPPDIEAAISGGGYVTIGGAGEFDPANTGTFRVTTGSTTSFTVVRPLNTAVNESNKASNTSENISLYNSEDTLAEELKDYINANLADFILAELIDDNGLNGQGIIDKSTEEDSNFAFDYKQLLDGQNYIYSTNLTAGVGLPQFQFKTTLALPFFNTAVTNAYAFTKGEVIKLVPTTIKQVSELINILAVTGASTIGDLTAVARNGKLQLRSSVLGSEGAVQIVGGRASISTGEVQQAATAINGFSLTKIVVERAAISGLHAGQWIKVEAQNTQKKLTQFSSLNNIRSTIEVSALDKTQISLSNRQNFERWFGKPRNFIRDEGRAFRVEKQGRLVAIIWDEVGTSPFFSKTVEINDGASVLDVTIDGSIVSYTIDSGSINFGEVGVGDEMQVFGLVEPGNEGTFTVLEVSDDGKTVYVNNENAVEEIGTAIGLGDIVINAEIQEGDSVVIGDPFAGSNQGTFRVIRRFNNTIWIENDNAVEENVEVLTNNVALTPSSTIVDVTIVDGGVKIQRVGGANPNFSLIKRGDVAKFAAPFNTVGEFVVNEVGSSAKAFFFGTVSGLTTNVTLVAENEGVVGNSIVLNGDGITDLDTLVSDWNSLNSGNEVVLFGDGTQIPANATSITLSGGTDADYFVVDNAVGTAQAGVTMDSVLTVHRPAMKFYQYDATIENDKFVIGGDVFGDANIAGTYTIEKVLSRSAAIVDGILINSFKNIGTKFEEIYVDEAKAYVGYKKIYNRLYDPSNVNNGIIIVEGLSQLSKINKDIAVTTLTAMSKLSFPSELKKGVDAYRYHTGLLRLANRIVYGDPRSTDYEGVAAAGAEIFIQPPLVRRIQVAIVVRLNTGVPFNAIVEQVRNNVSALINATGIGQSIAISDIVETVNTISGVFAVSISSPAYSPSNDVIRVNPSEKPFIIDANTDIVVSKLGL